MRASFDTSARRVVLKSGVAYFELAADPRPFIVRTSFGEVRAQGRAFVVRVDAGEAVVTVLDGTLVASSSRGASLLASLLPRPASQTVRTGDEALLARNAGPGVIHVATSALPNRLAWRDGHVALDRARLEDAALEVTRFSGVRFTFTDPVLGDVRVSGYFDGGDVDAFVAALRLNFGIAAERSSEAIVLRRAPAS